MCGEIDTVGTDHVHRDPTSGIRQVFATGVLDRTAGNRHIAEAPFAVSRVTAFRMPPIGLSPSCFNLGRRCIEFSARPTSTFGGTMTIATPFALPEAVLTAISNGIPVIQAYREHLGYTVDDIAVTSGLTVEEVEKMESGHRFEKGYRDRIARALGLPEGIFDEISDIPDAA